MKKTILVFLVIFLLIGCRQKNSLYPEYELKSISGKTLKIIGMKDRLEIVSQTKPMLFIFIESSCNACFKGIEHINHLYDRYKNKIDIIPILFHTGEGQNANLYFEEAQIINKDYDLNFDFYFSIGDEDFLQNFERQTNTNLIVLYDDKLRLIQEYEGVVPEEMIDFDINRILKNDGENDVPKP